MNYQVIKTYILAALKYSPEIPQKIKHGVSMGLSDHTSKNTLKRSANRGSDQNVCVTIYSSIIHSSHKVERIQVFINLCVTFI